jgi:dTDP-4-dehydrorhamnose reductase
MRILLTGATGQVGTALKETLPPLGEIIPAELPAFDFAQPDSVRAFVRAADADVIVNTAAYTAVDQAESEEAAAFAANRDGPAVLAEEAGRRDALLVHFSTDYVFDGEKPSPYLETDTPNPLNVYGRSKLAGEEAVRASGCRHLIVRTSWVYSDVGKNFLLTMLRLAGEGKRLRVVDDQIGAPTSSLMLARVLPEAIRRVAANQELCGTYHLTASGKTSWHGFAHALLEASGSRADLVPIASKDFQTAARRPRNSLLDRSKIADRLHIRTPPWEEGMRQVLERLAQTRR